MNNTIEHLAREANGIQYKEYSERKNAFDWAETPKDANDVIYEHK